MTRKPSLVWFRRDLRLHDHAALIAAAARGSVLAVFVVDPVLWNASGPVRRSWLAGSLASLNESLDGRLCVVTGRPEERIAELANDIDAEHVYASADFGVYGKRRDDLVATALAKAGRNLIHVGSPYAVAPDVVHTKAGGRFRVFTPYYRSWLTQLSVSSTSTNVRPDWITPSAANHLRANASLLSEAELPTGVDLPTVGEVAAHERWDQFVETDMRTYASDRDRPDRDRTSRLSAHLRWGEIHPNTLLRDLEQLVTDPERAVGAEAFRRQLAWRDFYAEIWDANPASSWLSLDARYDDDLDVSTGPLADTHFEAWRTGRTGYPIVDAGMRQLRSTGWMHNRVRMIVASFLVKDLHLPWQRGAGEFMYWLRDGDIASNQHNWQWVAGCGTDAAPFHRVFNPTVQGAKFDPDGSYVRQWVPELRGVAGSGVHEPWKLAGTLDSVVHEYPEPIVDHGAERLVALDRFAVLPPRNQ